MEIVRVLVAGPTAPAEARRSLRVLEGRVSPEQLDELRLVASELVANSVLHSGVAGGEAITLTVEVSPEVVRIEVVDPGGGFAEASRRRFPAHGWGLRIVDRLADRWGTERTSHTKVWAEFPRWAA